MRSAQPVPSTSPSRTRRWSNCPGSSSHGLPVHGHLGAEPPEAEVGPVADLAVAHSDQVGEAVAGHVRQVDGLLRIGEHQPRAPLLAPWIGGEGPPPVTEAVKTEGGVPGEGVVAGDQHVGEAVSVEVDHAQVRVVPGDVRAGLERAERLPAAGFRPAVATRHRAAELGQVQMPVAGQVEQLLPRLAPGRRGLGGEHLRRREPAPAEVVLVVPGTALPGQDAGQALPVQVHPLVVRAVHADGQVRQRLLAEGVDLGADHVWAVAQLERGQRRPVVAAFPAPISSVGDRGHRCHAAAAGADVAHVGGGHQAVRADARLVREVVEHQHPAAPAVGPQLEAGPVGGEWVAAHRPYPVGRRQRGILSVVAVVKDNLEEPATVVIIGRTNRVGARPPWLPVTVVDSLDVPVRRPGPRGAVALARQGRIDPRAVFGDVIVDRGVAGVVIGGANQPAEHV